MLEENYDRTDNTQKNESLEIVKFIKDMLESIDISNQSKIIKSLNTLESNIIK